MHHVLSSVHNKSNFYEWREKLPARLKGPNAGEIQLDTSRYRIKIPNVAINIATAAARRGFCLAFIEADLAAIQYAQAPRSTRAASIAADSHEKRHNPNPSRGRCAKLPGRIGISAR